MKYSFEVHFNRDGSVRQTRLTLSDDPSAFSLVRSISYGEPTLRGLPPQWRKTDLRDYVERLTGYLLLRNKVENAWLLEQFKTIPAARHVPIIKDARHVRTSGWPASADAPSSSGRLRCKSGCAAALLALATKIVSRGLAGADKIAHKWAASGSAVSSPARCSRASVTASRRFVLIRSPDRFGIRAGATTMHSWPSAWICR